MNLKNCDWPVRHCVLICVSSGECYLHQQCGCRLLCSSDYGLIRSGSKLVY